MPARRLRLQHDFEAALQIETFAQTLVLADEEDADERCDEQRDEC